MCSETLMAHLQVKSRPKCTEDCLGIPKFTFNYQKSVMFALALYNSMVCFMNI